MGWQKRILRVIFYGIFSPGCGKLSRIPTARSFSREYDINPTSPSSVNRESFGVAHFVTIFQKFLRKETAQGNDTGIQKDIIQVLLQMG